MLVHEIGVLSVPTLVTMSSSRRGGTKLLNCEDVSGKEMRVLTWRVYHM
jgi:hypothetical protein